MCGTSITLPGWAPHPTRRLSGAEKVAKDAPSDRAARSPACQCTAATRAPHARPTGLRRGARLDPAHPRPSGPARTRSLQRPVNADVAASVIRDELMLDGNARLNLATFVTTWMEPQAAALMAETLRQEHDRQGRVPADRGARAALRQHARPTSGTRPTTSDATGTSTTGLERGRACSAGMALKWRWRERSAARGRADRQPNIVMGVNVQVCWDKFCRYWEVEPRLVPMEGERFHLDAERGRRAAATRTRSASSRSSARRSTAATSRSPRSAPRSTSCRRAPGSTSRCTSTAPRAASIAPFIDPDLVWDFRLAARRSRSTRRATSTGCVYPGVGWVVWRDADGAARGAGLQRQLPRRRHADVRAQLLPARQPGRRAVLQLPAPRPRRLPPRAAVVRATSRSASPREIAELGPFRLHHRRQRAAGVRVHDDAGRRDHYNVFDVSRRLRERGWLVPAYTFPENREDLASSAIVVRNGIRTTWPTCCSTTCRARCPTSSARPRRRAPPARRRSTTERSAAVARVVPEPDHAALALVAEDAERGGAEREAGRRLRRLAEPARAEDAQDVAVAEQGDVAVRGSPRGR